MENELFLNAAAAGGISMSTWQALASSSMELQMTTDPSPDCFFWEKSTTDQGALQFDSALSSMVSSPAASNSNISNDSFVIRELIGKLGNINNSSCYSTPLSSPPKLNLPIMDNFIKEKKIPSLGNSMALNSSVAEFSSDPGFAERAAKFSRFGSRSFNGRTTSPVVAGNNPEFGFRSKTHLATNEKLPRVSSTPSLKVLGSQANGKRNPNNNAQDRSEMVNSQEETSSVSEQVMNGDHNISRKRKTIPKGKSTEQVGEGNENSNSKRVKGNEGNGNENGESKKEEEQKGGEVQNGEDDDKQNKISNNYCNNNNKNSKNETTKPPEPPKDYIHVRARRGQATDSHSLAERVRREKISERMKLLQDLVPGCNKVTGKALMLDEIINYVQSLQRQVECLSMKLASVSPRLDAGVDALLSKDMYDGGNKGVAHQNPMFGMDTPTTTGFVGHLSHQNQQGIHNNNMNGTVSSQCAAASASGVDQFDSTTSLCRNNLNMPIPFPPLGHFTDTILPQTFCEDDLQSIVQMGFGQNPNPDGALQSQNFHGSNQVSQHMKIEL